LTYHSRPDVDYLWTNECLRVSKSADKAEIAYKPASTNRTVVIAKQVDVQANPVPMRIRPAV